jgi:O-acetyl-ADP-ribose deacetylase (regulator of RNase III)
MIEIIKGNLLDAPEQYIAHQVNAISITSSGLANAIFTRFPYADIYTNRTHFDVPGTIIISGNESQNERLIIQMVAQFYPGYPMEGASNLDSYKLRQKYFYKCLSKISKIENLKSVAFPYLIGCGLAGGDWEY